MCRGCCNIVGVIHESPAGERSSPLPAPPPISHQISPLFPRCHLISFLISHCSFLILHNILCSVENSTTRRQKNLEKSAFCGIFPLTFADKLVYNTTLSGCMCVFAHLYSTTLIDRKGEQRHVPYLPAQEASSQDGARFPQENGYCQRP